MPDRAVRDLEAMLIALDPRLDAGAWCFCPLPEGVAGPETAFAIIREEEGACAILPAQQADAQARRFAQITLRVHSDLEAVGLTAAVSTALAEAGIACNIVAGLKHDHLFVPWNRGSDALALLERISADARR